MLHRQQHHQKNIVVSSATTKFFFSSSPPPNQHKKHNSNNNISPIQRLRLLVSRALSFENLSSRKSSTSSFSASSTSSWLRISDIPLVLAACRSLHNNEFLQSEQCQRLVHNAVNEILTSSSNCFTRPKTQSQQGLDFDFQLPDKNRTKRIADKINSQNNNNKTERTIIRVQNLVRYKARRHEIYDFLQLLWFVAAPIQGRTGRLLPVTNHHHDQNQNNNINNPFATEFGRLVTFSESLIHDIHMVNRSILVKKQMKYLIQEYEKENQQNQNNNNNNNKSSSSNKNKNEIRKSEIAALQQKHQGLLGDYKSFYNVRGYHSTDIASILSALTRGLSNNTSNNNNNVPSLSFVLNCMEAWNVLTMREKQSNPKSIHLTLLSAVRIIRCLNLSSSTALIFHETNPTKHNNNNEMSSNSTSTLFSNSPQDQEKENNNQQQQHQQRYIVVRDQITYRRVLREFCSSFCARFRVAGTTALKTGYRGTSIFEHELKEICTAIVDVFVLNQVQPIIKPKAATVVRHLYRMLLRRANLCSKYTQGEIGPAMRVLDYFLNNTEIICEMKSVEERRKFLEENVVRTSRLKVPYSCFSPEIIGKDDETATGLSLDNKKVSSQQQLQQQIKSIPVTGVNLVLFVMKIREELKLKKEKEQREAAKKAQEEKILMKLEKESKNDILMMNQNNPSSSSKSSSESNKTNNRDFSRNNKKYNKNDDTTEMPSITAFGSEEEKHFSIISGPGQIRHVYDLKSETTTEEGNYDDDTKRNSDNSQSRNQFGDHKMLLSQLHSSNQLNVLHAWIKMLPSHSVSQDTSVSIFLRTLLAQLSKNNNKNTNNINADENEDSVRFLLTHDNDRILKLLVTKVDAWVRFSARTKPLNSRWGLGQPLRIILQSLCQLISKLENVANEETTKNNENENPASFGKPSSSTSRFVSKTIQSLIKDVFLPSKTSTSVTFKNKNSSTMMTQTTTTANMNLRHDFEDPENASRYLTNAALARMPHHFSFPEQPENYENRANLNKPMKFGEKEDNNKNTKTNRNNNNEDDDDDDDELTQKFLVKRTKTSVPSLNHHSQSKMTSSSMPNKNPQYFSYSLVFIADMLRMIRWSTSRNLWTDQSLLSILTEEANHCAAAVLMTATQAAKKSSTTTTSSVNNSKHKNNNIANTTFTTTMEQKQQHDKHQVDNRSRLNHHEQHQHFSPISNSDARSAIEILYCLHHLNVDVVFEAKSVIDLLSKVDFEDNHQQQQQPRTMNSSPGKKLILSEISLLHRTLDNCVKNISTMINEEIQEPKKFLDLQRSVEKRNFMMMMANRDKPESSLQTEQRGDVVVPDEMPMTSVPKNIPSPLSSFSSGGGRSMTANLLLQAQQEKERRKKMQQLKDQQQQQQQNESSPKEKTTNNIGRVNVTPEGKCVNKKEFKDDDDFLSDEEWEKQTIARLAQNSPHYKKQEILLELKRKVGFAIQNAKRRKQ